MRNTALSHTGQDMGFLTEWIYNFLILSLFSLFPVSRVLSNISVIEKYLQDKHVMGAQSFSFGFLVKATYNPKNYMASAEEQNNGQV